MVSLSFLVLWFSTLAVPSVPAPLDLPSQIDSTQVYYGNQDAEALRRLLSTSDSRLVRLLCRYRLYPLTQDPALLDDLPATLSDATAAELALLSGLWGYRVMTTSVFNVPRYGIRANRLLDQAKAIDPADPFVLLIEGQSLLFRPAVLGGDPAEALRRFQHLCKELPGAPHRGVTPLEANLWVWYTLTKLHRDHEAEALKTSLLAQNPPPLYHQFLIDPP